MLTNLVKTLYFNNLVINNFVDNSKLKNELKTWKNHKFLLIEKIHNSLL